MGYFLCTSKESNKENLSPAALWLARCRKAMEFMPAGALAAHNAGGFSFLRSFLCVSQRNEPKKRAEGTIGSLWLPNGGRFSSAFKIHLPPTAPRWRGVSRGFPEVKPRGGGGIGIRGVISATIMFTPGAARSERLYRAFAEFCGLHWVSPWSFIKSFEAVRVSAPRVRNGGRHPIKVKLRFQSRSEWAPGAERRAALNAERR